MLNRLIAVSVAKNKSKVDPANKKYLPTNICHLNDLAKIVTAGSWSPIVWREGLRGRDNFVSCGLMVYDMDDGRLEIKRAIEILEVRGLSYLVGTTKSHLIAKDGLPPRERFRIIIPLAGDIKNKVHFSYAMRKYLQFFPTADRQCADAARQYLPCREIVAEKEGEMLDLVELTACDAERIAARAKYDPNEHARFIPTWVRQTLKVGVPEGERNCTVFKISLALYRNGMREDEILSYIEKSKFDLAEREVRQIIQSSRRYAHE